MQKKLIVVSRLSLQSNFALNIAVNDFETKKIGPWDLCWFKRLRIDLLCFFAIGCNFIDLSFMLH